MPFNTQLPLLATLELLDVSQLTNDLILHSPYWPPVSSKIPGDCPKFNGKGKEDPQAHVMTYHLWCLSNSYVDDSIRLCLFQQTLTGAAAKWYIELPRSTYHDFNSLAVAFLTHFQLLVRYETGTYLFTSLKQDTTTHISNHIREWRRRRPLIKFKIVDQLLTEWFTKSFIAPISHDISMGGCVTEDQAIARAQYLDLVYSQSGILYELLPNAPWSSSDSAPSKSPVVPPVDGVIGLESQTPAKTSSKQKLVSNDVPISSSRNPPGLGKTLEVHAI